MPTPLRTLVLEDEPDDYKLLMSQLRRAGFEPTGECVDSAADFLAHLDPTLDVILSDYTMPGFNGLEALRLMKKCQIDVPFIFVSGTIGEEVAVAAMQEGAADYLLKDRLGRLGPAVNRAIAQGRLKEEKQLAEQTVARLAAIVESSSDAIITTTLEGVIVTWNTAAERLYGYAAAEILGNDISLLIPKRRRQDDVPEDHQDMAERLRNGEFIEAYETVRVRKDRRRVDVSVSISPVRDADGTVLGASFIAHDISQRKRADRFLAAEHAVTRILSEARTLEQASTNLLQALADSLRWEAAVLWKVDNVAQVLRRVQTWHAPWAEASFVNDLDQQAALELDVGIAGRAWASGEPVWEPCTATGETRVRAAISIPMRLEGHMVGAIEFYIPEVRQPDAPTLAALANIASQISQFSERRQSEAALRASEERNRTLIAATAAIVWGMPASGEFETEQPQWTAFTGQPFDQLRGWGWLTSVHPEDLENTARVWQAAAHGRSVCQLEHRLRRADGDYRHMVVRAVPILEPDGAVREWVGVHTDVTDQKRAVQSQALLAAVINSSEDAVVCADLDGYVQSWNPAAERLFGYSAAEAVGRARFLIPLHLSNEVQPFEERLRRGEHVPPLETMRLRKDGTLVPVSITWAPIWIGGQIVGKSAIYRDITRQKQAEKDHALLASIVNSSDDAIISQTPDGIVTSWNPASERLFGWSVDKAIGQHISIIVPPDRADESANILERLNRGDHFEHLETVRLCQDGARIDVSITVSPIRDRDGRLIGVSKIARDITLQKRAERESLMLRSIIEFSPHFIAVSQPDTQVVFVNHAGKTLLGMDAHDEIGRTSVSDYHSVEEMDRLRREVIPILKSGGCVAGEVEFRHFQSGATIPAEWTVFAVPSPGGGAPAFFACVAHDITDRKRAEQELRESARRLEQQTRILQSVLSNMSDGVVVADQQGKFLLFNPAAERILHQGEIDARPEEWSGRYNLYLPDGESPYPAAAIPLYKALRGENSDDVEMIVNHDRIPEGRWITMSARPMHDESGILRGGIAVFRDITQKKRAENALRTSEERYRTLIAATAAIVWDSPASGDFDSVQPGWTAFTGQTVEQHRNWGWLNVIHPEDRETSATAWAAAVRDRRTFQVEHRLRRADGEYRHMHVRAVPIFESDRAIREWVGVHTDVTAQKRSEDERARLLTQLTIQIERMPLAYLLTGPDFRFGHWNPAAERMFGFRTAEVVGKQPFDTIVPSQSRAFVEDLFARLATGDMNAHGICENVTKDGTTIICEWHNTPLLNTDGTFQGIFSIAQDVTKRRLADQAVRDTQNRLKHVLASSPAVLFILAIADERIQGVSWVSDNIREMLGYPPEEALAAGWWLDHVHPEGREELASKTNAALFGKGYSAHEYPFRHADGNYRWYRSDIRLIRDESGVAVEAVGAWSDVTARKTLEDQFRQSQKLDAFGQLAGGVAHDFNNLLTIINGYSELLLQNLPEGDPSRNLVAEIYKAGERSAGLTRQLLAFSRQQVLAPRVLNLNEVVAETDKMLRRMIGEDVRLTTSLATRPWTVLADPGQVEQVLLNLAVNARDAMPIGGRLTIETRNIELDETYVRSHRDASAGPHVLLSVTDTGSGIPPALLEKIFEPFFTTKETGKGTGLGLATVYGIVKQSGGHVAVHSEVGVGTTFNVYLPRAGQETEDDNAPSQILVPPRGRETILLVEDEVGVRMLAHRILVGCGYKVLEAADGEEAVRIAAGHAGPIHLLLTDVVMPGMGGRVVAEQLAVQHPEARVLFLSGYTDDAVIRHGVLREGMNFLQKPFSPLTLASKIREVLDQK